MGILEIMERRHSVRQYTDRAIEADKRGVLDSMISDINAKTGLNIQVFYDEPKCFDSMIAHYGSFSGVKNYIALVGKKGDGLDERLGYYGEMLVLKAQECGLNTCWVALSHGKSKAVVRKGERQVCLISIGYGCTQGTSHRNKPVSAVSNCTGVPEWFEKGVRAALLAPTAMNQQKFYLELKDDGAVRLTCGRGFYTKLDLGIVKYHFEAVADKEAITK